MTKKTFRNLEAGDIVEIGYDGFYDESEFQGFTSNEKIYSKEAVFKNAKEMFEAVGVTSFKALEEHQDRVAPEYGHHFYALFKDVSEGYMFTAYLFHGRWCLGTSADPAKIKS